MQGAGSQTGAAKDSNLASKEASRPGLDQLGADSAHHILESSPDCIKVLDLDGRLLSMNAGGLKALEICDLASVIGNSWIDFWHGRDREAAQVAVAAARDGRIGRFVGYFRTTQTRKPRWWDVVVSPIFDEQSKPVRLVASSRDVTEWKRAQDLVRTMTEATLTVTGGEFFRALAQHTATALGVRFSFVAQCLPDLHARTLAWWTDGKLGENFEYDMRGTPCLEVAKGRTCHYPDRIPELFPEDEGMIELGTVSYLGVPLRDSKNRVIGHLVVFDDKPMPPDPLALSVLETFAGRAGAELERLRAEEEVRRLTEELAAQKIAQLQKENQHIGDRLQRTSEALVASEEHLRDLFDEAPIAYVHEGLDTRFIRANRAAMRILGIKPEQVDGTYGREFIPDSPGAQRRLREAFESVGKGTDTSGVVLELRRKDNGKPIWIQWWSKPDPGGTYTRTMFIDITDRVLMEQQKARLEAQNSYLQEEIRNEHNFGEIIGNDPKLLETLRVVEHVAAADSTVLILGETGTGKELIARAIHDRSPRRDGPLVKVNCGAISAGLVESELFGHVKGAFTGAITSRDGRFKLADGGTIFLDEVGELPMDTQVKLLRVLQEQEFEPIGSSRTIKVNVRVVAATNRDLEEFIREGKFRADLFYRLNVVPLRIPPLRERQSDIPLLAAFFLQKFSRKLGKRINHVDDNTALQLTRYPWPGNIRELQNVLERAVILSSGDTLTLSDDLRAPSLAVSGAPAPRAATSATASAPPPTPAATNGGRLEDVERRHIESVLNQTNWMIEGERGAAKVLNLNPSTLRSRMQKLGIKRPAR
jgi:PAS domain S-box-containing protein